MDLEENSAINRLRLNASQFVKMCNVMPLVHAMEGGVIELEELLISFVKYNKENGN